MLGKHAYRILSAAALVVFGFVLIYSVWERVVETLSLADELRQKEQAVLQPDEFVQRKTYLLDRRLQLTRLMAEGGTLYEQSQTGLLEFLTTTAQQAGVILESLSPQVTESDALETIGFTLRAQGGFHHVGSYVNAIESGPFGIAIQRLEISSPSERQHHVGVSIEGIAQIFKHQ